MQLERPRSFKAKAIKFGRGTSRPRTTIHHCQLVSIPAGLMVKYDPVTVLLNWTFRTALMASRMAAANDNTIVTFVSKTRTNNDILCVVYNLYKSMFTFTFRKHSYECNTSSVEQTAGQYTPCRQLV